MSVDLCWFLYVSTGFSMFFWANSIDQRAGWEFPHMVVIALGNPTLKCQKHSGLVIIRNFAQMVVDGCLGHAYRDEQMSNCFTHFHH